MTDIHGFVDTITDRKSTVADVHLAIGRFIFDAQGSSHRMRGDKFDEDLGNMLAVMRAYEKIISQAKARIRKEMRALDNVGK